MDAQTYPKKLENISIYVWKIMEKDMDIGVGNLK
jgi:hypothetical protein